MKAGLLRFPQDFGNGAEDARVFLVDEDLPRALAEKRKSCARERGFDTCATDEERLAAETVRRFVRDRLAVEAPDRLAEADADVHAKGPWDAFARSLQEDLVVMHRGPSGTVAPS